VFSIETGDAKTSISLSVLIDKQICQYAVIVDDETVIRAYDLPADLETLLRPHFGAIKKLLSLIADFEAGKPLLLPVELVRQVVLEQP
jgi:hypothetical protein